MLFFDPTIVVLLPALILALWAQLKVRSAVNTWSDVETSRGLTGAKAAEYILKSYGVNDVKIEQIPGELGDHYDPRAKALRLSHAVFSSNSVAAVGIAAHEAGHAIQHAQKYSPIVVRNAFVPVVSLGSNLAFPLFIVGIIFSISLLVKIGILLFSSVVAFHLITLPVEFDASRRATKSLLEMGILTPDEIRGAKTVLSAAAMTYIAAAAMAILNLIRLIILSRGRR